MRGLGLSLTIHRARATGISSPSDMAGLFGWFVADPAYCFSDNAGTVHCAADDPVAVWKARAGAAPDWIQTVAGSRPVLKLVSGRYYVDSDGVDDALDAASAAPWQALAAASVAIVSRNKTAGTKAFWRFGSNASGDWYPFGTDIYDSFGAAGRHGPAALGGADLTALHVYQVGATTNDWTNYLDNVQLLHDAANTMDWNTNPRLFESGGSFADRRIGEVVFNSAVLSVGDRGDLYAYLKSQWGTP